MCVGFKFNDVTKKQSCEFKITETPSPRVVKNHKTHHATQRVIFQNPPADSEIALSPPPRGPWLPALFENLQKHPGSSSSWAEKTNISSIRYRKEERR